MGEAIFFLPDPTTLQAFCHFKTGGREGGGLDRSQGGQSSSTELLLWSMFGPHVARLTTWGRVCSAR